MDTLLAILRAVLFVLTAYSVVMVAALEEDVDERRHHHDAVRNEDEEDGAEDGEEGVHLAVDASEHHVDAARDGHRIGDLVAAQELGEELQVAEARVAELEPIRVPRPVADDVGAVLAARVLLAGIALARRRRDDVGGAQKAELYGAFGQHVETLLDDLDRLAHLLHAHLIAVENVAVGLRGDLEVELGVHGVRSRATPEARALGPVMP